MKKLLSLLLVFGLIFGLAACSPQEEEPETETPVVEEEPEEEPEEPALVTITGKELFMNVNARKAFALGFDKQFIADSILANGSYAADYFVPRGFLSGPEGQDFREDGGLYNSYDPVAAAAYWAIAKEELGFDNAEVEFLNYDSDGAAKIAEFIKSELETNLEGLTLEITPLPFQQKLEKAEAGDYDFTFAGWGPDYLDATTFLDMWITDGGYNEAGYSNAIYDQLTATDSSDPQLRWDNMIEAERILLEEDVVLAPLYQRNGVVLQNPLVSNIIEHDFGPDFSFKWTTTEREDNTLRLLDTTKIPSLDANIATDSVSFNALNQFAEGLVRLGQTGSDIVPGVASSWSQDGLVYTFNLREDSKWVDYTGAEVGTVDAYDFVYSWDRLDAGAPDASTPAQYSYMLRDTAHVASYRAVDQFTFEVTLESDTPWFLSLMTFPVFYPLHEETVEALGADYGTTVENALFNGAFYLAEWTFSESRIFTKNELYWDAAVVSLDTISYRVIAGVENETAVAMYLNDEIDRTALSGDRVELHKDRDDAKVTKSPVIFYLMFNQGFEGFGE